MSQTLDAVLYKGQTMPEKNRFPAVLTPICVHGTQDPCVSTSTALALGRNNGGENAVCQYGHVAGSLTARHDSSPCADRGQSVVATAMRVRRLTPVECERLQGFNDNHTMVPHRGKPAADGPRYKAIGNSWAVTCARWIGFRIQMQLKAANDNNQ